MLGKGLESLIPKKAPQDGGGSDGSFPGQDAGAVPHENQVPARREVPQDELPREFERAFQGTRPTRLAHTPVQGAAIFHIEVEKIKPNSFQPRRDFNEDALKELASSIREFGVLQPIIVSKKEKEVPGGTDVEYELIAGERRWLAAKMLGLPRIPAIVRTVEFEKERLELAVIENLQRENLNPLETARAYARLQDEFRLTQREIAARLGKSRETVANTLRLLDLPSHIQEAIAGGSMSESHGRLLLSVTDKSAQEALFRDLMDRHFTTRELKARVVHTKVGTSSEESTPQTKGVSPELKMLEEKLSAELGAPVVITAGNPEDGGKIMITFYSAEELRGIMDRMRLRSDEEQLPS